jgi:hypothetical protein
MVAVRGMPHIREAGDAFLKNAPEAMGLLGL